MVSTLTAGAPGILSLPSGRLVRGRGLRHPLPDDALPEFGVYLLTRRPEPVPWESRWIRRPDFWLPLDRGSAEEILLQAWSRIAVERVEIACGGGHGKTGAALACLAVLDAVPAGEAVCVLSRGSRLFER